MTETKRFDTTRIGHAFGASASQYDDHSGLQQEVGQECLNTAKEYWKKNAKILDLGTGTGMLARLSIKQKLGWHITGLDLSFPMCQFASQYNVSTVNANAETLPFADAVFDGVFSSLMLQWVNTPLQFFKEMARVTKPGGYCIVSTFTHGTLDELRDSFASLDAHQHINEFGPSNYFSALAVHGGFQLLQSEEDVFTEYYPDVITLLRGLKAIGATTKEQGKSRKSLMTPRALQQVEHHYRKHFIHEDGLPVTWQVMTMILEKPSA